MVLFAQHSIEHLQDCKELFPTSKKKKKKKKKPKIFIKNKNFYNPGGWGEKTV